MQCPILFLLILIAALPGCKTTPNKMVWIPAGEFIIGTDEIDREGEAIRLGFPQPWYEDAGPQRKMRLDGFYLDQYETTQEEYLKFIRSTGHRSPDNWPNGLFERGQENHPVSYVDWYDANDYCQWASKRLPTEEEWEKGARGADGRLYPWGNRFEAGRANVATNSALYQKTVPVGSNPLGKSPYGISDMIGNVWEWTDSWYLPYPGSRSRNKEFGMKYRVVRGISYSPLGHYDLREMVEGGSGNHDLREMVGGGSDGNHPEGAYQKVLEVFARASTRSYEPPTIRLGDVGFRCAKSAGS